MDGSPMRGTFKIYIKRPEKLLFHKYGDPKCSKVSSLEIEKKKRFLYGSFISAILLVLIISLIKPDLPVFCCSPLMRFHNPLPTFQTQYLLRSSTKFGCHTELLEQETQIRIGL